MPMLKCPNDPEHKDFVVTAMVPETWFLNEDGEKLAGTPQSGGHIESDFTDARCQECSCLVEITAEDN